MSATGSEAAPELATGRHELTLLESRFPFREISLVALADRQSRDHVYAAHKWWARRPPAVIRAILLAAALPADTDLGAFWKVYRSGDAQLAGHHVGDPFMGGATTLVEAARLGATVTGIDVDPMAVRIARQELAGVDGAQLRDAGSALLEHLDAQVGSLFGRAKDCRTPLHYFFLRRVSCPACEEPSLLYRNLVLGRDAAKPGAVVRGAAVSAFCPDCLAVHELADGADLDCCTVRDVDHGTFAAGRFTCPRCSTSSTHQQLRTARHPRILIAVEETSDERRAIRAPDPGEDGEDSARAWWENHELEVPATPLGEGQTARARNYGFRHVRDLFSLRQLAVFATAFAYLDRANLPEDVGNALRLAISNGLASNNLLCGYATDYGRLAPLFTGVRAYSMPVLSVELNPLHRDAGRGTLAATVRRVAATEKQHVRRHAYDDVTGAIEPHDFVARRTVPTDITCRSADRGLPVADGTLTMAVSDPPYFDYISYSDLSLFFRAWNGSHGRAERLAGAPIYPVGENAEATFRDRLAAAFAKLRKTLRPDGVFCFTFHATSQLAWNALGQALTKADFTPVSAFPVWADGRAASHGHAGNCEWDLVLVCRPTRLGLHVALPDDIGAWVDRLDGFTLADADTDNLRWGLQAIRTSAVAARSAVAEVVA